MKTKILIYLVLMFCCINNINATVESEISCEDFEDGQVGGWIASNAMMNAVTGGGNNMVLDVTDLGGASWIFNPNLNNTNIGCGSLTYDYLLLNDGLPGVNNVFNQVVLITDTNNPSNQLNATFVLSQPITENTGWVNITVPIHPVESGTPLPGNAFGQWQMADPTNWNTLVSSFTAVLFPVDVLNSPAPTEHFQLDDICFQSVGNFDNYLYTKSKCINGAYNINASSGDQFGYDYSWELYETDQYGQTTGGTLVATGEGSFVSFIGMDADSYYYVVMTATNTCLESYTLSAFVPVHVIENSFHFEDSEDNIKTTFCYGEDVYLDGTASTGETDYWIGISRRPIPNNGQNWQNYEFLGWEDGEVGEVNLSEAFADLDYDLEPGWEYRITLALQNLDKCVNWEPSEQYFVVECCADFFDPAFDLERRVTPVNGVYALVAVEYELYENVDVQHTWTIYSSPNLDGGPYTFVDEVTGDELYYEVGEGLCYFVIHSIETLCGEYCYGQSDCINAGGNAVEELCDLCGPIDCSILDELCMAPSGLQFDCQGVRPIIVTLSWSAIPNVPGYVVEITWNDDECCVTPEPEVTIPYFTSSNQLVINELIQPDWDCFRWRVGTVCENGAEVWSDYQCFNGCFFGSIPTVETALPSKTNIFPNPTNDLVQLSFEDAFTGEVQLTDKLGRVIQTQSLSEAFRTELDLTSLPTGLYWVVTVNEAGTTSYKLIKQ